MCLKHFDVLFTYNQPDEIKVLQVAAKLREYGLEPWVKREQIRPGTFYQDSTQQAMASINCSAIFIGSEKFLGLSILEVYAQISKTVKQGTILIPVLLPGVEIIPEDMLFLNQIEYVRFVDGMDDCRAIEDLVWAIKNQRPENSFEQEFDVLLCYNQEDKPDVISIAEQLKQKQIQPWLDIWQTAGNQPYKQVLKDMKRIRSVAFLIGSQGCPWQKEPFESVLEEFFENVNVRLIPVMLKNVPPKPDLPVYLKRKGAVDFRHEESKPLEELIRAIRQS